MGVTVVSLSKSVLVNMGDYQNEKVEIGITYEVEPGETVEEAHAKVADQCRSLLARELEPVLNSLSPWRAKPWRELLGLPVPEPVASPAPPDDDLDEDEEEEEDDTF